MCAIHATFEQGITSDVSAFIIWNINHKNININAGIGNGIKMNTGIIVSTFAYGYKTTYPPSTPDIAPLAPIMGIDEFVSNTY